MERKKREKKDYQKFEIPLKYMNTLKHIKTPFQIPLEFTTIPLIYFETILAPL
jgi:hypothetical protein